MSRLRVTSVLGVICFGAWANGAPPYRFVSFAAPTTPFTIRSSGGLGVLQDGRRVYQGWEDNSEQTEHIYLQKDGLNTFVEPPAPFKGFLLNGYSQAGDVCGKYPQGAVSKAAYSSGGTFYALPGEGRSVAYSMNSSGRVVGFVKDSGPHRPVMWDNGFLVELDRGGLATGLAECVTEDGTVYGELASNSFFNDTRLGRWRNGVLDLPLGNEVIVGNIRSSPAGAVAMRALFPGETLRPVRILNGTVERLTAPPSSAGFYEITGVNDGGNMVGFGFKSSADPIETRMFYLWHGNELLDLKSLVQPDQNYMQISHVSSITNKGEISGKFLNKLTGRYDPGLLVPVPEPSAFAGLFGIGLAFCALRRRSPCSL